MENIHCCSFSETVPTNTLNRANKTLDCCCRWNEIENVYKKRENGIKYTNEHWKIQYGPPWLRLWTQHTQHTYLLTHKWLELIRIVGKNFYLWKIHKRTRYLYLKKTNVCELKVCFVCIICSLPKAIETCLSKKKLSFRTNCNLNVVWAPSNDFTSKPYVTMAINVSLLLHRIQQFDETELHNPKSMCSISLNSCKCNLVHKKCMHMHARRTFSRWKVQLL